MTKLNGLIVPSQGIAIPAIWRIKGSRISQVENVTYMVHATGLVTRFNVIIVRDFPSFTGL
jgi:hypothetical protein